MQLFDGNCPHYFDPGERKLLTTCLDRLNRGDTIHQNTLASYFFVLEKDGNIQACGGYYLKAEIPTAVLAWGMVHHEKHHQGLGSIMLRFRINHIKTHYPDHDIQLDTSQHTYRFFESFGFQVSRIIPDAYGPGLHRYDMLLAETLP